MTPSGTGFVAKIKAKRSSSGVDQRWTEDDAGRRSCFGIGVQTGVKKLELEDIPHLYLSNLEASMINEAKLEKWALSCLNKKELGGRISTTHSSSLALLDVPPEIEHDMICAL